jgi:hypothetical protein
MQTPASPTRATGPSARAVAASVGGPAPLAWFGAFALSFGALAALELLPLADPASLRIATGVSLVAGLLGLAARASTRLPSAWFGAAAVLALLAARWPRDAAPTWAPEVVAAIAPPLALLAAYAAAARICRQRGLQAWFRVAAVVAIGAAASSMLLRGGGPTRYDNWIGAELLAPLERWRYPGHVSASVYGLCLFPLGALGLWEATRRRAELFGALLLLLLALVASRHYESAWPIALAATGLPALLCGRSGTASAPGVRKVAPPRSPAQGRLAWSLVLLPCAFALVIATRGREARASAAAPRIGFVAAMHGSFEPLPLPEQGSPSPSAPPRFGEFRRLLERRGAQTIDLVEPAAIASSACDALITINLCGPDARAFVEPLRAAVENGTRLLVLADHTDMFEQIAPTNDLLRDTGIELRFDSVVPRGSGASWTGAWCSGRDALFGPSRHGEDVGWGVGCSLGVAAPARALALGTRAFIDPGVESKAGGLGNLKRDRAETLGGMPVAAESRLGVGSVLAFGDTSAVQDTALIAGRPFALRLANWLEGRSTRAPVPGWQRWLGACALGCLALAVGWNRGGVPELLAALASLVLAEGMLEGHMRLRLDLDEPPQRRIDLLAASVPGIPLDVERLDPLFDQCASLGWTLSVRNDTQPGARVQAFALVDPWAELGEATSRALLERVAAGDRMLLLVGARGARGAAPLLRELGLELGHPLGQGLDSAWSGSLAQRPGSPHFLSAYELRGPGLAAADVLAECFGLPVAAAGSHGRGRWLVIADAGLAWERSVEPRKGGNLAAAVTLQVFLERLLKER